MSTYKSRLLIVLVGVAAVLVAAVTVSYWLGTLARGLGR